MNETVWVYQYTYWDEDSRSQKVSSIYATLEAIRNGLGTPVLTGGHPVPVRELQGGLWIPAGAATPIQVKRDDPA